MHPYGDVIVCGSNHQQAATRGSLSRMTSQSACPLACTHGESAHHRPISRLASSLVITGSFSHVLPWRSSSSSSAALMVGRLLEGTWGVGTMAGDYRGAVQGSTRAGQVISSPSRALISNTSLSGSQAGTNTPLLHIHVFCRAFVHSSHIIADHTVNHLAQSRVHHVVVVPSC